MKNALFILTFGVFFINSSLSQSGPVPSGGLVSNGTTTVSFSIGQVFDNYVSDNLINITEGIQQPFLNDLTRSRDLIDIDLLRLNQSGNIIDLAAPSGHTYILWSGDGKILECSTSNLEFSKIDLNHYLPGIYFLGVFIKESYLKTFKVIVL